MRYAIYKIYRNLSNKIAPIVDNVSVFLHVLIAKVIAHQNGIYRTCNCIVSDYNVTSEMGDNQGGGSGGGGGGGVAANQSLVVNLKAANLSPVKSSNASDQIALLPTAEPIDNNNSVYQNYDAMCRNSTYNNRETLICDVPLNKSSAHETKEDYYNFVVNEMTDGNDVDYV